MSPSPLPLIPPSFLQGGGHVHTSQFAKDGLMKSYFKDVTTLYDNFQRGKRVSSKFLYFLVLSPHSSLLSDVQIMGIVLVSVRVLLAPTSGCRMGRWRNEL